jgi:general secretion pathway protein F
MANQEAMAIMLTSLATIYNALKAPIEVKNRFETVDLQLFAMEMATFLRAGLSIPEAIDLMQRRLPKVEDRKFASALYDGIAAGKSLSIAIEETAPRSTSVLVALVRSSEQSGLVAEAFERFAIYKDRITQAKRKLITAMIYPTLLIVVGLGVVSFLLLYVVPQFAGVYANLGTNLPWASLLLLQWGQFISSHPRALLVLGAALIIVIVVLVQSSSSRAEAMNSILSIGPAKKLRREFELGRFYYTLGLLLTSGLSITNAIALAKDVLGKTYDKSHATLLDGINRGLPLSESLKSADLSTEIAERLLKSGESSGSVSKMLEHAAKVHEDDTWRTLERFTKIFEPVSMVILGLLIGAIVVLMYLPIFELSQAFE